MASGRAGRGAQEGDKCGTDWGQAISDEQAAGEDKLTTNHLPLTTRTVAEVFRRFKEHNANPVSELHWTTPFTLLVSVVLSAQATDKSVNVATPALFARASTPQAMSQLGAEGVEPFIRAIGLYRVKAKHIAAMSKMLVSDYCSCVPHTREELMTLPGVGRKSANVVLNVAFGEDTMPVDTHVKRVAKRLFLSADCSPTLLQIEQMLLHIIPQEYLHNAHHWLLLHGRYVCTARAPKCNECLVADLCRWVVGSGGAANAAGVSRR